MKAVMNYGGLKNIIKSMKNFIPKCKMRPIIDSIQLYFDKSNNTMTAVALDGFKMHVRTLICDEIDESFNAKIGIDLPIGFEYDVAVIEKKEIDKESIVFIKTGFNQMGYKEEVIETFKYDDAIPKIKDRLRMGFNRKYLIDCLKAIKDTGVILEIDIDKSRELKTLFIRDMEMPEDDYMMVLPVRLREELK